MHVIIGFEKRGRGSWRGLHIKCLFIDIAVIIIVSLVQLTSLVVTNLPMVPSRM